MKRILVTGVAGFIGGALALKLVEDGTDSIVGVDNMNGYYDVRLKSYRLKKIEVAAKKSEARWGFSCGDIANKNFVNAVFEKYHPTHVVNLAAQAGVRYSIDKPQEYVQSNLVGFFNILEACRCFGVERLIYASSSTAHTDSPSTFYGVTKKGNELMAGCYSNLYSIPITGLRFFTVYGEAGRPDMFYFKFVDNLLRGETIELYNYGQCERDFTYIGDVVKCVVLALNGASGELGHKVYDIGNGDPMSVRKFTEILQSELVHAGIFPAGYDFDKTKRFVPMQAGDAQKTCANMCAFEQDFGFKAKTSRQHGLRSFVDWYKKYNATPDLVGR